MTTVQDRTMVFKDAAGEYYAVPWETLERGLVPAEHKAEVEQLIAEQQDEVQGYACSGAGGISFTLVYDGTTSWMGQLAVATAEYNRNRWS